MTDLLYHASDDPSIALFLPRPVVTPNVSISGDCVWAIDDAHVHNYLLPRDCPRVTFLNDGTEHPLLAGSTARAVVAIEREWLPRLASTRLYLYEFDASTFEEVDAIAGYYISRQAVRPVRVRELNDLPQALLERDVELRILPDIWKLHDAVASSSLPFSIIRMRNARPRDHHAAHDPKPR